MPRPGLCSMCQERGEGQCWKDQKIYDEAYQEGLKESTDSVIYKERHECIEAIASATHGSPQGDVQHGYELGLQTSIDVIVERGLGPDNCEKCHGEKGGVPGNENRVDGRVLCDFCTAEHIIESEEGGS